MDTWPFLSTFLDKTRPPATRIAEVETVRQLVVGPSTAGPSTRPRPYEAAWNALRTVLLDPTDAAEVRQAVTQAIRLLGDRGRQVLTQQVPGDQEPQFQRDVASLQVQTAIPLLHRLFWYGRDPRVLAILADAAHDPDPAIREAVQWGLGMLGELSVVVQALGDEAPAVRVAAAESLGRWGVRPEDLSALEGTLADSDPAVREAAQVALRRLGLRSPPRPPTQPVVPPYLAEVSASLRFPWVPFLVEWMWHLLQADPFPEAWSDDAIASGWVGSPVATEAQLVAAEQRLGRRLPPSYREFLRITNGWRTGAADY